MSSENVMKKEAASASGLHGSGDDNDGKVGNRPSSGFARDPKSEGISGHGLTMESRSGSMSSFGSAKDLKSGNISGSVLTMELKSGSLSSSGSAKDLKSLNVSGSGSSGLTMESKSGSLSTSGSAKDLKSLNVSGSGGSGSRKSPCLQRPNFGEDHSISPERKTSVPTKPSPNASENRKHQLKKSRSFRVARFFLKFENLHFSFCSLGALLIKEQTSKKYCQCQYIFLGIFENLRNYYHNWKTLENIGSTLQWLCNIY
jgi:hypothetical protein